MVATDLRAVRAEAGPTPAFVSIATQERVDRPDHAGRLSQNDGATTQNHAVFPRVIATRTRKTRAMSPQDWMLIIIGGAFIGHVIADFGMSDS